MCSEMVHALPIWLLSGEMTGLTRKTINAVLRRLQADGVLACDYRRIEIRDVDRLRDIARLST